MPEMEPAIINMAIVGGGPLCRELIAKAALDYRKNAVRARIVGVADPDIQSPGMVLARELGLKSVKDYHELYEPHHNIHLLVILTPEQEILNDILKTKPDTVRILSHRVFDFIWKVIGVEERKLRMKNREMETILNGIQDYILLITPDMEIIEVNEAFLKGMGHTRKEVIGRKCHEIFHGVRQMCDKGGVACPLNEAIRNKRSSQQIRTRAGQNGEPHYIEVTIFPIWESDGRISRFVEISRDITDRKKEEEEITRRLEQMVEDRTRQLKETHAQLLHQDKMASMGKLSASVVHEINNPIAGILNLITLMKRIIGDGGIEQNDIDEFSRYLDLMETETRRTSRIVSNLLAFSRQSKIELKRLDLNQIVEQTLLITSNLLKINGIRVEKQLDPDLPEFEGSEDQIQQAFMNFVSNAAEAMESTKGGVLTIETTCFAKPPRISISFRDTGIGIQRENISKLFDPFFTTKKVGKGVGLGLSVAYGIIESHCGSIRVRSKAGKGTTFEVELPLKQPSSTLDQHGDSCG
ncbi:MAG: ATP-binding protein [Thermodesulfobacteriota bacterium]|nr:ATP-binding protein [Thermodesulfobacteriota bacterium]